MTIAYSCCLPQIFNYTLVNTLHSYCIPLFRACCTNNCFIEYLPRKTVKKVNFVWAHLRKQAAIISIIFPPKNLRKSSHTTIEPELMFWIRIWNGDIEYHHLHHLWHWSTTTLSLILNYVWICWSWMYYRQLLCIATCWI